MEELIREELFSSVTCLPPLALKSTASLCLLSSIVVMVMCSPSLNTPMLYVARWDLLLWCNGTI